MGQITGRKVFVITASAFAVIIAVNVFMAVKAVSTFPGLEVSNSYVASQSFDADRNAQAMLDWTLTQEYDRAARQLRLTLLDANGQPAQLAELQVLVGRPTSAADDMRPDFIRQGSAYIAGVNLQPGKWMLHVEARSHSGVHFKQRLDLVVEG
jgi:nitrogen fixation protein FixH